MKFIIGSLLIFSQLLYFCNGKCNVIASGVSKETQRHIVTLHNNYRRQLANGKVKGQPRAINLKRISWDESLAKEAQIIAETCKWGHVDVKDKRFDVGQNLGFVVSNIQEANWTQVISSWWNEHKGYKFPREFTIKNGHYRQMAWAKTHLIGCGFVAFKEDEGDFSTKYFVCNYGPGGNVIGQPPYKNGHSGCQKLC
ncbi:venom allergen 5-like [Anthonomus grandis grandis]|uniref:venom allergen 5-like n=1 Tax=Anthonomus grandis grandis TaxID=2921223 RepID=UPI002166ADCD|nr:venom allergen 5-like [Anthonomus grandis grandis]